MSDNPSFAAPQFEPRRVLEFELSQPLPAIPAVDPASGRAYCRGSALVRLHSQPLGLVALEFGEGGLTAGELAAQIWAVLSTPIADHLRQDGLDPVTALPAGGLPGGDGPACLQARAAALREAPFISVVVPTHDRPQHVATCLPALAALDYPRYEMIIVDNAPSTPAVSQAVQQLCAAVPGARYVREERPGACWARNRGLLEARGEIVAFTDDDVVVDRYWLAETAKAFRAADRVGCVTGNILARELETPAQVWFEARGGFSRGFIAHVYDLAGHRAPQPLYPYSAMMFGSGNSMAFRTALLRDAGGFDPALDITSPSMGGEDLAAFFEAIARGYQLVYEPAALGHHLHRRDYEGLLRQIRGWGVGFAAFLTRSLLRHPDMIPGFFAQLPYTAAAVLRGRVPYSADRSDALQGTFTPEACQALRSAEYGGYLAGLTAYPRSRLHVRRVTARYGPFPTRGEQPARAPEATLAPTAIHHE